MQHVITAVQYDFKVLYFVSGFYYEILIIFQQNLTHFPYFTFWISYITQPKTIKMFMCLILQTLKIF
jgi:hypothetical protein